MPPGYWQHPRGAAHEEGRHTVPQVDCGKCWEAGRFRSANVPDDPSGLWHRGQHAHCITCSTWLAEHKPPANLDGD